MRMNRWIGVVVWGSVLAMLAAIAPAWSAEKAFATQTTKDVVITLKSDTGGGTRGKNAFAVEFASAKDKQPPHVGKVALSTSMAMPRMAPMIPGAPGSPAQTPGRYARTN